MTNAGHEGRSIKLRSGQKADGTWVCEYTIIEPGHDPVTNTTGAPQGSFSTREEAEAAAWEAAQAEIDSRGPIA
jgi:hypothetical protein